jgi:hypothetical protein
MFDRHKKADCPLWQGPCREHGCRFWTQVAGTNPQTGAEISEWNCAIAFLPMLLIQNSLHERQTGAAVESFRNEMVRQNQQLQRMLIAPPEKGDDNG